MSKNFTNESITQTGVGQSNWIIIQSYNGKHVGANKTAIDVRPGADATIDIEVTINVDLTLPSDTVPAGEIRKLSTLTGVTSAGDDLYDVNSPIKAVRINQTAGNDPSSITILKVKE